MGTTNNTYESYSKGKGYFNKSAVPISDRIVLNDVAADGSVALPANAVVKKIIVNNKTANAITGGLDIGSASAGTQYASAMAIVASSLNVLAATAIQVVPQTTGSIFYKAHTAWNGANIDLVFEIDLYPNT